MIPLQWRHNEFDGNEFNNFFANVALNIGRNDNISLDEDILSIADS